MNLEEYRYIQMSNIKRAIEGIIYDYLDGLTIKEIATKMELPADFVRQVLNGPAKEYEPDIFGEEIKCTFH
jgi:coproporphyrinogen III oxidase